MQDLPHHYAVIATDEPAGEVALEGTRLPTLGSASPAEFGGPGDRWSPETFLVGAIADCFVLTFRAVARASKVPWTSLRCEVRAHLIASTGQCSSRTSTSARVCACRHERTVTKRAAPS